MTKGSGRVRNNAPTGVDESVNLIQAVAQAPTEELLDLLKAGDLDPAKQLRFQEWSGSSFAGNTLDGCDFTGARLLACDFNRARLSGARFDKAIIDKAGSDRSRRTRLCDAADWKNWVKSWRRAERPASDAHLRAGAVFQDAPFAPEMVVIPPGEFTMGSPLDEPERYKGESPQRHVRIAQPYAIGRYAVTFNEWDFARAEKDGCRLTGVRARKGQDEGWGRGDRPVINASWADAQAYVRWIRAKTGEHYRLPSEAEWEYACRAGTSTPFWWGSSITPDQANYHSDVVYTGGGKEGEWRQKTVPVDEYAPNPWGLYQVHGNVLEWAEDLWHDSYDGAPDDGSARVTGNDGPRVLRGGSWGNNPRDLRAAYREWDNPGNRSINVGFRLARTLNP